MRLADDVIRYHAEMLSDRVRTMSYLELIGRNVRSGDVVIDIGTGTGIFAIAAARAGAAHVYAIEAGPIARVTEELFRANGVLDCITLIRNWSTLVRLPKAADVVVSELIGNDPLAERVLGITKDAIRRFLRPGGRLLPSGLRILGFVVELPDDEIRRRMFRPQTLDSWSAWYGLEFGPLASVEQVNGSFDYVNPRQMRNWKRLTEPILLAEIDFKRWNRLWIRSQRRTVATADGRLDGFVVYFELLADGTPFLSTHPAEVKKDNHWLSPLYLFDQIETVESEEAITLSYRYQLRTGRSYCVVRKGHG